MEIDGKLREMVEIKIYPQRTISIIRYKTLPNWQVIKSIE